MKLTKIIINEISNFLDESRQDYLNWKRKNVTIRGVREDTQTENGGGGMLGLGLYTAFLSNYAMAKTYGKVYFVLNAIPKHPIVFNTLNDWEIWQYNTMVTNYCKRHGVPPSSRYFHANTSITEEIKNLGYDGVVIKGREMVNYSPDNPIFFEHEYQLENYYNAVIGSGQ